MEEFLKKNDLELRHAFAMAHAFKVGQPNYPLCGRILPNTIELGDCDAVLCKRCKNVVNALKEESDGD